MHNIWINLSLFSLFYKVFISNQDGFSNDKKKTGGSGFVESISKKVYLEI